MRLVDGDALKITKIVERKRKLFADGRVRKANDWTDVVLLEDIENAPTVEAVEVVRCKNCKHWWKENKLCCNDKCCNGNVAVVDAPPNHFCSYGERRKEKR